MRLSSLEIKGFKSFADKTIVNFNNDVTGIVGPNGCGKSNIVDAIRWVLGEQKTSALRSEKMENLIFNGTKQRRASGIAEVTLTFDNTKNLLPTEFSNVKVSRVYYRNGDSEYRLNNVACRLKDIQGLFMNTGISSDSYAIIELKMIDDILSDKDNSRRKLFEQAAGIGQYKKRKKETLSKLNATQQDLERVDDLLFEIENNLKSLESQAKKTKKFYQLKEDYKVFSIELAVFQLMDHKTLFKKIHLQLEQEQDRRLQLDTAITTLDTNLIQEKTANIDKEKTLANSQKQLNDKIAAIKDIEAERNLLSETQRFLKQRIETLEKDASLNQTKTHSLSEEIEQIQQDYTTVERDYEQERITIEEKKLALKDIREKHQQLKQEVDAKRISLRSLEKEIYDIEKQLAVNKVQRDTLNAELQRAVQQVSQDQNTLDQLKLECQEVTEWRNEDEATLQSLQAEQETINNQQSNLEEKLESYKINLNDANRIYDAKSNEYKLTKSMVDKMEGFPASIKFLKTKVEPTKDAPLVSDLISCDDAYKTPIENYLDPYLNYYVLKDTEAALECVEALSRENKGRANFFLLSELDKLGNKAALPSQIGKRALDLVEYSDQYKGLFNHLLENVYLVDELPENDSDGITWLSNSGKFVKRQLSLAGGSIGAFEGNRLGRLKNLEKLTNEVDNLKIEVEDIKSSITLVEQERAALKSKNLLTKIEEAEKELNQNERRIVGLSTRIEHIENGLKSSTNKDQQAQAKIEMLEAQHVAISQQLDTLEQKRAKLASQSVSEDAAFVEVSNKLNEASSAFNEMNIAYHQLENRKNALQQTLSFKEKQLSDTTQLLEKTTVELQEKKAELTQSLTSVDDIGSGLQEQYDIKEGLEEKVVKSEEAYYASRGTINEIEEKLKVHTNNRNQCDMIIQTIKDKETELKLELSSMRERLKIQFDADINELINRSPSKTMDAPTLQLKVEKIEKRLDNFGDINPMAVEAYEEMSERHLFIQQQKNDLMDAQENLMSTIKEIDDTATEKFMSTFSAVRDHFKNVFRSLFREEDTCELKLVDPDKPLESAIDISARPKGKRPLTINQLSGGEKSLTAIALLFALYLIKPAPFCIFDEVDAPLDDANVTKFASIIRKFAQDSQFIVVTHNKQTMASVDVIYGVTMLEAGISRVVPVDFGGLN